jgi:hypothetical protein
MKLGPASDTFTIGSAEIKASMWVADGSGAPYISRKDMDLLDNINPKPPPKGQDYLRILGNVIKRTAKRSPTVSESSFGVYMDRAWRPSSLAMNWPEGVSAHQELGAFVLCDWGLDLTDALRTFTQQADSLLAGGAPVGTEPEYEAALLAAFREGNRSSAPEEPET